MTIPRRALALSAVAATILMGASLLPSAVATAAPATPVIVCPQDRGIVGLPIGEQPFTTLAPGEKMSVTITGTVPDGLVLGPDLILRGTPTRQQGSAFTVRVTVLGADGTTAASSDNCSMQVRASPKITRVAGTDRYDQSVQVSRGFFGGASTVYLASGEKFADALSASALAAAHRGPVLLTPAAEVTPGVLEEIRRLKPDHVAVVGGSLSVSDAVIGQLGTIVRPDIIERIGGADRYEVSRNLIANPTFGVAKSAWLFIANGANFPDALSASPAAAYVQSPVLLVNGTEASLTPAERALVSQLGVTMVNVIGGPASIGFPLEADLARAFTTTRYGGADRFEVSRGLNTKTFVGTARTVFLASGMVFPDALSGGVPAAIISSPMAITQQACLSLAAAITIGAIAPQEVVLLGGAATLSAEVEHLSVCA